MGEKSCPACGYIAGKSRSTADHRRFFAVIRAAFQNWPENHEFQPDDAEHLRAWLLCRAGYRDVTTIPVPSDMPPSVVRLITLATEASIKAAKSKGAAVHAFVRPGEHAVAVFSAKSIDFNTLDQREFGRVRDAVEAVIAAELHVTAADLLRATRDHEGEDHGHEATAA